jgi:hypothetical protein
LRCPLKIFIVMGRRRGSFTFSLREKVPEGRMRGLWPENVARTRRNSGGDPLIRRYGATFSQREKEVYASSAYSTVTDLARLRG